MNKLWRQTFLLHSRTEEYQKSLNNARNKAREVFSKYEYPAVAFSGGKDSLVMLSIVQSIGKPYLVFHYDFGRPTQKKYNYFPLSIENEILKIAYQITKEKIHIVTKRKYWQSSDSALDGRPKYTFVWFVEDSVFWVRGQQSVMKDLDCDVALVGLRKGESIKRRLRIKEGDTITNFPEKWIVADMSEMDIWAYIVSNNLSYLSYYDKKAELQNSYLGVRLTSLFRDPQESIIDSRGVDGVLMWKEKYSE